MALLDLESELDRSRGVAAFANGFEGEAWMSLWCADCVNDADSDCPLIAVAMLGRTPAAFDDVSPGALNRYVCREFIKKEEQE